MVYYILVKITIDAQYLADVVKDIVVQHHSLPNYIMTDKDSLFTLKF